LGTENSPGEPVTKDTARQSESLDRSGVRLHRRCFRITPVLARALENLAAGKIVMYECISVDERTNPEIC